MILQVFVIERIISTWALLRIGMVLWVFLNCHTCSSANHESCLMESVINYMTLNSLVATNGQTVRCVAGEGRIFKNPH